MKRGMFWFNMKKRSIKDWWIWCHENLDFFPVSQLWVKSNSIWANFFSLSLSFSLSVFACLCLFLSVCLSLPCTRLRNVYIVPLCLWVQSTGISHLHQWSEGSNVLPRWQRPFREGDKSVKHSLTQCRMKTVTKAIREHYMVPGMSEGNWERCGLGLRVDLGRFWDGGGVRYPDKWDGCHWHSLCSGKPGHNPLGTERRLM